MGRQWRGMGGLEDHVFFGVDRFCLILRGLPPKQKHHLIALVIDHRDDLVRELLPAALGVGVGLAVLDGERGVEQEDSLLRPLAEVAVLGHSELDLLVAAQVLVDVLQRGRRGHGFEHAEAESMGLSGLVVRVLADNDHLDAVDGRHLKRVEDVLLDRIDLHTPKRTFLPDSYSAFTNL